MVRRNEKLRTMNRALLRTLRELQVGAGEEDPEYCHDEYASCYNKYYEERCPVKCGGSSNAVDKTEINEDIQGCVPCKCNTHDPTADPAYTDCGATDDSAFWRYGPSYINCYEPSNRQGKYEFKLFGSCPEKAEPQDSCMCVTSWTSPGECEVTQYGCPAFACEDPAEPRWCIVADDGCIGGNLGGYMECDDDTPVFGESEVGWSQYTQYN